jgi:hypothetical protein
MRSGAIPGDADARPMPAEALSDEFEVRSAPAGRITAIR